MRTNSFRLLTTSLAIASILFGLLQTDSLAYAKESTVHQTSERMLLAQTTTQPNTFGLDESKVESGVKFTEGSPYSLIGIVINVILSFLGIIFLVIVIYAGVLWMTASGNSDQIKKAKNMIQNAIIGLIVVAMAYIITQNIYDLITTKLPSGTGNQQQTPTQ